MKKNFILRIFFKIFSFCVVLLKYGKGKTTSFDLRIEEFKNFIDSTVHTLGQCIKTITLQSGVGGIKIKNSLNQLMQSDNLLWLDFCDYDDKTCMPGYSKAQEILTNFSSLYKQEKYATFNMHKRHFLYIMSNDYSGGYDYFRLTAGNSYARDFIEQTAYMEHNK